MSEAHRCAFCKELEYEHVRKECVHCPELLLAPRTQCYCNSSSGTVATSCNYILILDVVALGSVVKNRPTPNVKKKIPLGVMGPVELMIQSARPNGQQNKVDAEQRCLLANSLLYAHDAP